DLVDAKFEQDLAGPNHLRILGDERPLLGHRQGGDQRQEEGRNQRTRLHLEAPLSGGLSRMSVTGPSLTSDTSICAPNSPVSTCRPRARSAAARSSYNARARPGGAAPMNDGRRPRLVSP